MHARSLVVSLAALLVVATPPAGASNSRRLPLRVQTASLTQHGQQLSWSVELIQPFSPTATFLPASAGLRYRTLRWQVLSTLRPPACVPALPDRIGCFTLFPATAGLARLHTPELVGCVPSGAPFVTGGPTNRHVVALTFDDGPWYDTPQFLDVLEREHVEATFFEIGEQISTYGEGGRCSGGCSPTAT